MFDPSQALSGLRIPSDILIAMDNRALHFAMQPFHFLIRAIHIVAVAAFFGSICLLDLRLLDIQADIQLRRMSQHALPTIYAGFGVSCVSGLLLFLYDPLHVGSHAYFSLKLIFIVLGLANAGIFHKFGFADAAYSSGAMPRSAKIAGGLSLAFWVLVLLMASLNVEGPPKVLLNS